MLYSELLDADLFTEVACNLQHLICVYGFQKKNGHLFVTLVSLY